MQAFLIYRCQLCGEHEDIGPVEITEPPILTNVRPPEGLTREAIWHQCYKKADLNLKMWGVCKFVGMREIAPPKEEENKDSKSVGGGFSIELSRFKTI
jgi:hypothetical protein